MSTARHIAGGPREPCETPRGRFALSEVSRPADLTSMDDQQLVSLVLRGESDAYAVIVERYKDTVYHLTYRMLGNAAEAEDAAQETFVRAWSALATYKGEKRFITWLLAIASHLSIDALRRRRFQGVPLDELLIADLPADEGPEPEEYVLKREESEEFQKIIGTLPEKYQGVLYLRYWGDLSYEEIGLALKLTSALVKARLRRARELIGKRMDQDGDAST